MRAWAYAVVGAILGSASTWWATQPATSSAPMVARGPSTNELRAVVAQEVRAALREQVAREATDRAASEMSRGPATREVDRAALSDGAPDAARDTPAAPSPQLVPVRTRLAERIARAEWTDDDRDWLRGALDHLRLDERQAVVGELIAAINSGRLKPSGLGPPL